MKALSISNILSKKYKKIEWSQEWKEAFGIPESSGMWCIWGNSGNGKTTLAILLAKELSNSGKVLFNSHEEGIRGTMQDTLETHSMLPYDGKISFGVFSIDELKAILEKRGSYPYIIFDSIQAAKLGYKQMEELVKMFPQKLFVFVSRAKGDMPSNKAGEDCKYDADVKIQVKGFRAISHGRRNVGKYLTIWAEKAIEYYGN